MYIDFSLFFTFVGIGFVSWMLGIKLFFMIAFWGSIFYTFANYSIGYAILTAVEVSLGGFIAWLVTGERTLK